MYARTAMRTSVTTVRTIHDITRLMIKKAMMIAASIAA
jgi:hypothetical protein